MIYKLPHILPCMHENKQNLACCQLVPVFITNCGTILRLICQAIAYKYTTWQRNKLLTSQGIFCHSQQRIDNNLSPDSGMFAPFALFIKKPHIWFIDHEFRHNIFKVAVDPDPQITLTMLLTKFIVYNTGVSIKFEVGSWLEKSNRPYEQGAVRPLNLGGSGGMLPQKI